MKLVKRVKVGYILISVAMLTLGLVIMIWPELSAVLLSYLFGGILVVLGILRLVGYFSNDLYRLAFQFDLALGILTLLFGIALLLRPLALLAALPFAMGVYISAGAIFAIQTAVEARGFGLKSWWLILVSALLCCVLGALLLFHPFGSGKALVILLGAALALHGLQNLIVAIFTVYDAKKRP